MKGTEAFLNHHQPFEPAGLLVDNLELLPEAKQTGLRALDIACGRGRNALFLAQAGFEVDAVDISEEAVRELKAEAEKRSLIVNAWIADLTKTPIEADNYDLIICFNYLQRDLSDWIKSALKPGGVLAFETFTEDQPQFGKPHHPDHLLKKGELLSTFKDMRIFYYSEGIHKQQAMASLLAQKKGHAGP